MIFYWNIFLFLSSYELTNTFENVIISHIMENYFLTIKITITGVVDYESFSI